MQVAKKRRLPLGVLREGGGVLQAPAFPTTPALLPFWGQARARGHMDRWSHDAS